MLSFLIALVALVLGYFIYGGLVERVFNTDSNRPTPALTMADGIDYVALPTWKVYLIQFLNIAGVGPIFGAIMGIMYGPAAFLWIVLGTIFAGAVHDFMSGMISLRLGGKSLPEIVGSELGKKIKIVMSVFTCILLLMVIAVFVRTPANLLATLTPDHLNATFWAICIFLYYILATLLPVDKLIGNLYPLFGFALLFMAVGIMGYMIFNGVNIPDGFSEGLFSRHPAGEDAPIFPMMCISIACGAISGFHATQSPMMARCLKNEKHGRMVFYGAMVSEGIVALIWAAAAIAFTGGYGKLADYMASHGQDAGILVHEVCVNWLGTFGGILAILGVIAAPITTGDTAMRSLRLIVADAIGLGQKKFVKRLLVTLPIIGVTYLLININFDILWRYFAWCNQTLSIFTLWACSVFLVRNNRNSMAYLLTMIPAMFMTALCVTFICYAPMGAYVEGIGLPIIYSECIGLLAMIICTLLFMKWKRGMSMQAPAALSLIAISLLTLTSCRDENDNIVPGGGDQYQGPTTDMDLGPETAGFNSASFTLALETPDGTVIERVGNHMRLNSRSHLNLTTGLADGIYRLLYLEYPITDNPDLKDLADQFQTTQFGLGSRVEVKNGTITVLDHYDEEIGLPGRGTADEPYEISSYNNLIKLAQIVNSEEKNRLITKDTHFRQTGKIDLYQASREVDRRYGWLPIGLTPLSLSEAIITAASSQR